MQYIEISDVIDEVELIIQIFLYIDLDEDDDELIVIDEIDLVEKIRLFDEIDEIEKLRQYHELIYIILDDELDVDVLIVEVDQIELHESDLEHVDVIDDDEMLEFDDTNE